MTPFHQFQVWLRRAGIGQRATAGAAALLICALLAWMVMPSGGGDGALQVGAVGSTGTPSAPGATGASGAPGGAGADAATATPGADPAAGAAPGAAPAGGAPAPVAAPPPGQPGAGEGTGGQAATCPPGTGPGATERQVDVAITLINIAGAAGNGTLGVPSPEVQREQWQIVADSINAAGGAGCRQLALQFYSVNPINASEAQQKCLEIANAQPFIALDTGSLTQPGYSDCIPNSRVPMMAAFLTRDQLEKYHPYYIAPNAILDDVIRTGVLAFAQQGHFEPEQGFEKLGLLYRTCRPAPMQVMRSTLAEVGMPKDEVVEFDLGCPPGGQNTPVELQQAAITFKRAGVSHVTVADVGDVVSFTRSAAQQAFTPQYLIADDKVTGTISGTQQPDPENFDGAIVVDGTRYGEQTTPGASPDEGTQRCNEIFAAAGYPPVWEQDVGYGGVVCSMLWMVKGLLDNVPQMQREALAPATKALGARQGSYPWGPADYSATPPSAAWGKPLWRNAVYSASCRCFQVPDLAFQPAFR